MSKDDASLFRAIKNLGDDARPKAIAESMEMSEPMVLTLINRSIDRLIFDGENYSLTQEAEDVLRSDAASGSSIDG